MTTSTNDDLTMALKIAFCYMPQAIEVTSYEYGERTDKVKGEIEFVRETLLSLGIDPDEVSGEINPDQTPNSSY